MGRRDRDHKTVTVDDYDDAPIDEIPPQYRGEVRELMENLGDEDTTLIKQRGPRGGGATGGCRADLDLHFHIGDVDNSETNINFNVGNDVDEEDLEEARSLFEKLVETVTGGGDKEE